MFMLRYVYKLVDISISAVQQLCTASRLCRRFLCPLLHLVSVVSGRASTNDHLSVHPVGAGFGTDSVDVLNRKNELHEHFTSFSSQNSKRVLRRRLDRAYRRARERSSHSRLAWWWRAADRVWLRCGSSRACIRAHADPPRLWGRAASCVVQQ